MTTRVFVYGTLKRGFPNHGFLARARWLGKAHTLERYPMAVAGPWFIPVLLRRPGEGRHVRGELYAVDPLTLEALDDLEGAGHPDGYERAQIELAREPEGETLAAQVYFKSEPSGQLHTGWLEDYQDRRYVARESR